MTTKTSKSHPHKAGRSAGTDRFNYEILEDLVGFMIRLVQLRYFRIYYQKFEDVGLNPAVFSILLVIRNHPGVRQGVVANAMMIKRSNMTKVIQALERKGLVVRKSTPDHKRGVALHVTPKGKRLVDAQWRRIVDQDIEATASAFSRHERRIFLGLLSKLNDSLLEKMPNGVFDNGLGDNDGLIAAGDDGTEDNLRKGR